MACGPDAAGAAGRDAPPGRFGTLDVEERLEEVPVLSMADIVKPVWQGELYG